MMNTAYRRKPARACEVAILEAAARRIGAEARYWHARRIRHVVRLGVAAGVMVMVLVWLLLAMTARPADDAALCASWEWGGFEAESRALATGLADLQRGN